MHRATPALTAALAAALALALPSPVLAHLAPGEYGSFAAGFTHPLFGLDHVLAMVAVGLWAALIGGRALWALPLGFVSGMVVGFSMALAGIGLPFVEPMILASTVVFGLVVALALRTRVEVAVALVVLFALFHGHAHGGELGQAGVFAFAFGFALNTALLHLAGIGIGLAAVHFGGARNLLARATGVVTAILGLGVILG
jgi:urease accessory protein